MLCNVYAPYPFPLLPGGGALLNKAKQRSSSLSWQGAFYIDRSRDPSRDHWEALTWLIAQLWNNQPQAQNN